jgi:hypothetical protein
MTRWYAIGGVFLGIVLLGWLLSRLLRKPADRVGTEINESGPPPHWHKTRWFRGDQH